jgi:hypothetical protein
MCAVGSSGIVASSRAGGVRMMTDRSADGEIVWVRQVDGGGCC